MKIPSQRIRPKSRDEWLALRKEVVTSTEMAGLFGVSRWTSAFQLWHEKRDLVESSFVETERTKWGLRLEKVVAEAVAEKLGIQVWEEDEFRMSRSHGIGASYDFKAEYELEMTPLEVKTVDPMQFREHFVAEGDELIELPLEYELQLQTQLALYDSEKIIFGVLVGGNKLYTIIREEDPKVLDAILKKAKEFQEMTEPPAPSYEQDADTINKIYSHAEVGEEIGAGEELDRLMGTYAHLHEIESGAAKGKSAVKAQIQEQIGTASKIFGSEYKITRSKVKPTDISYTRAGYLTFKMTKVKR